MKRVLFETDKWELSGYYDYYRLSNTDVSNANMKGRIMYGKPENLLELLAYSDEDIEMFSDSISGCNVHKTVCMRCGKIDIGGVVKYYTWENDIEYEREYFTCINCII